MLKQHESFSQKEWSRLLSHRGRGFGYPECTLAAIREALRHGVNHVEIDTRHTADGEIVVHHSPVLKAERNRFLPINELTLADIKRLYSRPENTLICPTLQDMVRTVKRESSSATLHIDVKDIGLEEKYIAVLAKEGFIQRVHLNSWIPEVLEKVHKIERAAKLTFTYIPIWGKMGRLVDVFERVSFDNLLSGLAGLSKAFPLPHDMKYMRIHLGWTCGQRVSPKYKVGFNHAFVLNGYPPSPLYDWVLESKGAISIPIRCANRELVADIKKRGFIVHIFTARSITQAKAGVIRFGADIVFCDDIFPGPSYS